MAQRQYYYTQGAAPVERLNAIIVRIADRRIDTQYPVLDLRNVRL